MVFKFLPDLPEYYNYTPALSDDERYYLVSHQKHVNNVFIIGDFNDLFHMPDYLKIIPMLNINDCYSNRYNRIHNTVDHDSLSASNNIREIIHQNYYKDVTNELVRVNNAQHAVEKTTFKSRRNHIIQHNFSLR